MHAVRPHGFAIPIRNFQCHRTCVRHRQVHIGGDGKRVRVVLRQDETAVGNGFVNARTVLHRQCGVRPVDSLLPAFGQVGDGHAVELHIMIDRIPSREGEGDGLRECHNAHQGNGNKA